MKEFNVVTFYVVVDEEAERFVRFPVSGGYVHCDSFFDAAKFTDLKLAEAAAAKEPALKVYSAKLEAFPIDN